MSDLQPEQKRGIETESASRSHQHGLRHGNADPLNVEVAYGLNQSFSPSTGSAPDFSRTRRMLFSLYSVCSAFAAVMFAFNQPPRVPAALTWGVLALLLWPGVQIFLTERQVPLLQNYSLRLVLNIILFFLASFLMMASP